MAAPQTAAAPATAPKPGAAAPTDTNSAAKGAAAPATPAEVRKMKLKLEGQDVEMPESEVIALAQQGKVSAKRFQEAAAIKKQAEDILKFAKENPREFFKKTGMNAREWAENYLIEELKAEQMTPEQKELASAKEKLKEHEAEKKRQKDEQLAADLAREQAKHVENYNKMFVEALTKSGLPKTAYTVKRMAELQLVNIRKGLELSADDLAKVVKEDYIAEQKALFGAAEGDALIDMLGPDIVKKLSKAQIAKLKAKTTPGVSGTTHSKPSGTGGLSWRDYQKRNRGRL